jgi:hypothetical protein
VAASSAGETGRAPGLTGPGTEARPASADPVKEARLNSPVANRARGPEACSARGGTGCPAPGEGARPGGTGGGGGTAARPGPPGADPGPGPASGGGGTLARPGAPARSAIP